MTNVELHTHLCEELNALYEAKNHDYGNSFEKAQDEFGLTACAVRIADKYNRFIELSKGTKAKVKDESIRDTLRDMANYCLMTIMILDKEKEKNGC